jgi:NADH dehydrogenase
VLALLDAPPQAHAHVELAGPEVLTQREVVTLVLRASGRRRRTVPVPLATLRAGLRGEEALAGPAALVTWDEAQLLSVDMLSSRGSTDVEALGVRPRRMSDVLGVT